MARTTVVKSARKDQGRCQSPSCKHPGEPIQAGQSYKWFKRKSTYGGTVFKYHTDCRIPQTHRSSSRMAEIYEAQEMLSIPSEGETSDLEAIASEFAQVVREVSEGYGESADNIEEGFGHSTYQSDELREKADALESWADDLEDIDFEEFDEDDALEQARSEWDDQHPDNEGDATGIDALVSDKRQEWWDEQVSKLEEETGNCPV